MNYDCAKTFDQAKAKGHQAILIAESFQSRFKPMSHEHPKALFPLANVPVIHYAIQFLVLNNITNIVIATPLEWKAQLKKQVDKLKQDSEFTGKYKRIKVTYFTLQDASNLGNTLREVNDFESLEEQFLVMYSDIVCNANIEPAIKMHWDAIEE